MKFHEIKRLVLVLAIWLFVQAASAKAQSTFTAPITILSGRGSFQYGTDGSLVITATNAINPIIPSQFSWNPSVGSISLGGSSASGYNSTASGYSSSAPGTFSMVSGFMSTASGYCSFASGMSSSAYGAASTASGYWVTAGGNNSCAFGNFAYAGGNNSVAFGNVVTAGAFCSIAVGAFNVGGGNGTSWVATDPLFEIGNGTGSSPSDAVLVQKNGNMTVQGTVTFAPGGDVPMFSGTN
jgi:hypothetical protein